MPTLDWSYQDDTGEYHAMHNGFRIRAVRDESPTNPFEEHDGHWPMIVRYDGRFTSYDRVLGASVDDPLSRFTPEQLVWDQRAILEAVGTQLPDEHGKWTWDPDIVMEEARYAMTEMVPDSEKLATYAALYALLLIPCVETCSTGYSQGDYADLLIVGTPEARKLFGVECTPRELSHQSALYSAWAWGDVYGYVIERIEMVAPDDFEDDPDYFEPQVVEELDSCWGYYGVDFAESGLTEAALSACPEMAAA